MWCWMEKGTLGILDICDGEQRLWKRRDKQVWEKKYPLNRISIHVSSQIRQLPSRGQFRLRVYTQLLRLQIPKAKKAAWVDNFFALLGSAGIKAARKTLMKLTLALYHVLVTFYILQIESYFVSFFDEKLFQHISIHFFGNLYLSVTKNLECENLDSEH